MISCKTLSIAIKVPLRPTPAEQCTTIGLLLSGGQRFLNISTNRVKRHGGSGTPKSGQLENIERLDESNEV